MTTSAVYDLIPNEDGGQNTRYPLGDKPAPELAPPVPNNFATGGETLTSVDLSWGQVGDGHTKFVLQRWRINTDAAWATLAEPGKDTRNYTDSANLVQGQHVGYRIASSDGVNQSDWAPEAWTYVLKEYLPPSGGEYAGLTPTQIVSDASGLTNALASASAGDIIGLQPGVYVGTNPAPDLDPSNSEIEALRFQPAWAPAGSGVEGNPIIIVARYPASTHTDPSKYTDLRSGSDGTNWVTGGPWYNPVQGRNSTLGWPAYGGGYFTGGGHTQWIGIYSNESDWNNKIYEDCGVATLRGHDGMSTTQGRLIGDPNRIYIGNNYSGVRLEDTRDAVVADNYIKDFYGTATINTAAVCLFEAADYVINNNDFNNCLYGVYPKGGGQTNNLYGTMMQNHIHDCYMAFRFHAPAFGPSGERTLIKQNLVEDCVYFLQQASAGLKDIMEGCDFINNTAVGLTSNNPASIEWTAAWDPSKDNTFVNNIQHLSTGYFLGAWDTSAAKVDSHMANSYNCITTPYMKAPESHTLVSWRAQTGQEVGSITSDPLFVASGDYRLQAGSPCRTSGKNGGVQGCYITGNETIGVR